MRALALAIALLVGAPALAQDTHVTLSGTVLSKKGQPVDGATVRVDGTTIGGFTDEAGRFALEIPTDQARGRLLFRMLGYKSCFVDLPGEPGELEVVLRNGPGKRDRACDAGWVVK